MEEAERRGVIPIPSRKAAPLSFLIERSLPEPDRFHALSVSVGSGVEAIGLQRCMIDDVFIAAVARVDRLAVSNPVTD